MKEKPFLFSAHMVASEGVLYPQLDALGKAYRAPAGGTLVRSVDQREDELQDDFMVRLDGLMRDEARHQGVRYADNVLISSRKAI